MPGKEGAEKGQFLTVPDQSALKCQVQKAGESGPCQLVSVRGSVERGSASRRQTKTAGTIKGGVGAFEMCFPNIRKLNQTVNKQGKNQEVRKRSSSVRPELLNIEHLLLFCLFNILQ
ncbi:uncharacterized protein V6R79_012411 [Siganus canaliculatus]